MVMSTEVDYSLLTDEVPDTDDFYPPDLSAEIVRKLEALNHEGHESRAKGSQYTPKKLLFRERQRQALEMRKMGATYSQIAEHIGWAHESTAQHAVSQACKDIKAEGVDEMRAIQGQRLDHMLMAIWADINDGEISAISAGLRILESINRLYGLESVAPTQTQNNVLVVKGDPDDYLRRLKQMAGVPKHELEASNGDGFYRQLDSSYADFTSGGSNGSGQGRSSIIETTVNGNGSSNGSDSDGNGSHRGEAEADSDSS